MKKELWIKNEKGEEVFNWYAKPYVTEEEIEAYKKQKEQDRKDGKPKEKYIDGMELYQIMSYRYDGNDNSVFSNFFDAEIMDYKIVLIDDEAYARSEEEAEDYNNAIACYNLLIDNREDLSDDDVRDFADYIHGGGATADNAPRIMANFIKKLKEQNKEEKMEEKLYPIKYDVSYNIQDIWDVDIDAGLIIYNYDDYENSGYCCKTKEMAEEYSYRFEAFDIVTVFQNKINANYALDYDTDDNAIAINDRYQWILEGEYNDAKGLERLEKELTEIEKNIIKENKEEK